MKRIGVITLYDEFCWDNYGGRLQNYALVKKISEYQCHVETIGFNKNKSLFKLLKLYIYHNWGLEIHQNKVKSIGVQKKRNKKFKSFTEHNVPLAVYWINDNKDYFKVWERYDVLIVGSDQVWNTDWAITDDTKFQYLLIGADNNKRYSYAASFGNCYINPIWSDLIRNELLKFKCLSVREKDAGSMIKNITGRDSELLLDPVFLLNEHDWESIEIKWDGIDDSTPYIITYFLGNPNPQVLVQLENLSEQRHEKILHLGNINYIKEYNIGPEEFIYLIHHASCVITDSFHASAFSIIFNTPFWVISRQDRIGDMSSRIITLLEKFHLLSRLVQTIPEGLEFSQLFIDEYEKIIGYENKKALKYLDYIILNG